MPGSKTSHTTTGSSHKKKRGRSQSGGKQTRPIAKARKTASGNVLGAQAAAITAEGGSAHVEGTGLGGQVSQLYTVINLTNVQP